MVDELVSVIIPTYNRAYCLERAINSVLAQSHRALEIIVVDDGSSDGTDHLIATRYGGEQRVCYLRQANLGVAAARNRGLAVARGDYVALLDSDDTWKPWKLELQLCCLRAVPEAGMIWTDMEAIGPEGKLISRRYLRIMYHTNYRWFSKQALFSNVLPLSNLCAHLADILADANLYHGDVFSAMVMGNLVHTSTVLLRRDRLSRVGGFNEALEVSGEDYDFHLRTCREGPVAFADVSSIEYQVGRSDQLTNRAYSIYMARNFLRTLAPILEQDRNRIKLPAEMIAAVQAHAHGWLGAEYLQLGERTLARKHLHRGLRHRPWRAKLWVLYILSPLPPRMCRYLFASLRALRGKVRSIRRFLRFS